MENEFNKIKYISEKIKLSNEEKIKMRGDILSFIKSSVVSEAGEASLISKWPLFDLINFNFKPTPALFCILLILGASGGASLAAESALPGDLLYPIKVVVNEEVRAVVSFSAEAKANWETRRLERRLEEVERLAHKKEFNAEARTNIEENFEAQAKRIEKRIAEFESKGETQSAADLSSNFEVSLGAHEKILSKIDGEELNKFISKVKAKKNSASLLRIKAEALVSGESSMEAKMAAEGKMKSAENKISEAKKFLEKMSIRLGIKATVDAESKVLEAQKVWVEGKTKIDTKAYGEAFILFQRAHRMAQEAKLLIEALSEFKVDFKDNGGKDDNSDEKESDNGKADDSKSKDTDKRTGANLKIEAENESSVDIDTSGTETHGKGNLDVRFDLGF